MRKKRKREMDAVDFEIIRGKQSFEKHNQLNPIEIKIEEDRKINFLKQYKNYTYQFKVMGFLFSSGMVNETREIFLATNGLVSAKTALINGRVHQIIVVVNLDEIKNWENMKKPHGG